MAREACDIGRKQDYLYRLMVHQNTSELKSCASQVQDRLRRHACCHPSLRQLIHSDALQRPMVLRAMVLFAMHVDDDFMQWLLEHTGSCSVSLSKFRHDHLPAHVNQLLNGDTVLDDFVSNATVDYICC